MRAALALMSLLLLASAAAAAEPAPLHVLVLDIKSDTLDEKTTTTVTSAVAVYVSRKPHVMVTSGAEIQKVLALEAERQTVGCDTDSCLSEIADAMGARFVVLGHVGKVGSQLVLTLSLFDGQQGASVGRALVQADDVAALFGKLPRAVDELMDPFLVQAGIDVGPPPAALWLGFGGGGIAALGIATALVGAVPALMYELGRRPLDAAIAAYEQEPSLDAAAAVISARHDVDTWTRHWQTWGVATLATGGVLVVSGAVLMGSSLLVGALSGPSDGELE